MDATQYLSPTDAKADGSWPNPRWRMRDREAIAARLDEDGRRIAAEKGDCTVEDLVRLGWLQGQVLVHQAALARQWAEFEAEIAEALATAREIAAPAPQATGDFDVVDLSEVRPAPSPREPRLDDMDVAYGCERAA